jgi:hypothetical protein
LKYGKYQIVRFMLRKGHKYTAYKNLESGRMSMRINSDEDEEELANWIKQRVIELKTKKLTEEPKNKKNNDSK